MRYSTENLFKQADGEATVLIGYTSRYIEYYQRILFTDDSRTRQTSSPKVRNSLARLYSPPAHRGQIMASLAVRPSPCLTLSINITLISRNRMQAIHAGTRRFYNAFGFLRQHPRQRECWESGLRHTP